MAPEVIKPTALALNILVGAIATWQFYRAGNFSWDLFWPFAVLAVPFAFVGGKVSLPTELFKFILGLVLLYSATRLLTQSTCHLNKSTTAHLCFGVGCMYRFNIWAYWHWWRHFSYATIAVYGLGRTQARDRGISPVCIYELSIRLSWQLCLNTIATFFYFAHNASRNTRW